MNRRPRGIVCYDGECSICTGLVTRWGHRLRRAGFRLVPLQAPSIQRRLGLNGIPDEMKLITAMGDVIGGADAVVAIAEGLGLSHDLAASARSPLIRPMLRQLYAVVAKHRSCVGGSCRIR
ncbi:MAG TPA: DCC1-like thiol-disulfide oxidoreductase family protein [Planctomycetota bacterium]|nr:DCC1-like thiol-disulfide oxidoreductase family protein [Planctomycetota bacterium]